MRKYLNTTCMAASVFSLGTIAAFPVLAQEEQSVENLFNTDTFIVTARRRDESLLDVPGSLSVFSESQIERLAISNYDDLTKFDTSIDLAKGTTPRDLRPSIRGLSAERGRSNVGILIDGIDITTENVGQSGTGLLGNLRLVDIERIEVVKGPQSALYGRSAFAGAVNYITRKPGDEIDWRANAEYGEYGRAEIGGAISGPLSKDVLAAGLNAFYAQDDGAYDSSNGQDVGGFEEYGLAASINFTPTDKVSFFGRLEYSEGEADPSASSGQQAPQTVVPFGPLATSVLAANPSPFAPPGPPPAAGLTFVGDVVDGPNEFLPDPTTGEDFDGSDYDTFRTTLTTDIDFGRIGFQSLTSFLIHNYDEHVDQTQLPLDAGGNYPANYVQFIELSSETTQFSEEIRLFSQEDSVFDWMVGALYWKEDIDHQDRAFVRAFGGFPPAPTTPSAIAGEQAFIGAIAPGLDLGRTTEHWSVFAWAELDVTDRLALSAEFRYSDESIEYDVSGQARVYGVGAFGAFPLSPVTNDSVTSEENFFTPKISLRYAVSDTANAYLSAAKGVKPAGFNTIANDSFEAADGFETEQLWSYEAGVKTSLLDNALQFNGAVFYMDYTDQQVQTTRFSTDTGTVAPFIDNAGESSVLGLEADALWSPTDRLTLRGAYTYLDSEFESFEIGTTSSTAIANAGGECASTDASGGGFVCVLDLAGNALPFAPEHSFSGAISFQTPLSDFGLDADGVDVLADLSGRYVSDRFIENENNIVLPAYARVDLQTGLVSDTWEALLYVENLFDDDTVIAATPWVDGELGFARSALGFRPDPRRVGVRVRVRN